MVNQFTILLMAAILHQFIGSLSHYLQGFIHPRWCRISAINSMAPHLDTGLGGAKSSAETQRLVAKLIRNCRKTGDSGSSCCCCCLKKRGGSMFFRFPNREMRQKLKKQNEKPCPQKSHSESARNRETLTELTLV